MADYGWGVFWDEAVNQIRAHQELQKINSPVRVPVVYYAFKDNDGARWTYIVMEYIRGDTVGSLEDKARESPEQSQEKLDALSRRVAFALDEFLRIPVPLDTPPASVSGGIIRHSIFKDHEAPRPYQNVEQLEQHFNMEPLVFCYCDVHGGNFMIDEKGEIVVIDFGKLNTLPLSFAKFVTLSMGHDGLGLSVRPWVHFPDMGGQSCANADVLLELQGPMVQSSSFGKIMRRVPGCPPPGEIF
ncbi:hypothetical protein SLS63_006939 [Diaporthe eres]|uniref:Aminoglycoside phosphotransferase domain-containing protein n=1 Tax=Diaporthe eres TaxID=83184 RepID=A0ABR1P6P4_DIAER